MGSGDSVPMPPRMSSHADKAGNRAHPSRLAENPARIQPGGARPGLSAMVAMAIPTERPPRQTDALEPWGEWRPSMRVKNFVAARADY
jgi:hypothetical protein